MFRVDRVCIDVHQRANHKQEAQRDSVDDISTSLWVQGTRLLDGAEQSGAQRLRAEQ